MSVHSVLGAEDITGTALSDLATILRVMDDKKGLKEKLLRIADETAKLAAERAAVGSLQQIEKLRSEAERDRDKAGEELTAAGVKGKQITADAMVGAKVIIGKAEDKANKNTTWSTELERRLHILTEAEDALVREQQDVLRRETEAKEAQDKADDLMREAEELKRKFQDKLDAMAKLQAA